MSKFSHGYPLVVVVILTLLAVGDLARSQDWPQWRGALGQGTTTASGLPPRAGSSSLKVLWKTAIPGEGCSSPIVCQGRVYLTTAYEGSQRHPLDVPGYWAAILLACEVVGMTLTQIPRVRSTSPWGFVLGGWTTLVVVLIAVVLAKPKWFWQFVDPWSGTSVAPAELDFVESLHLRPVIVLVCGSLLLIAVGMPNSKAETWMMLAVTFVCTVVLGLVIVQPEWFLLASQPWLAWLVTGGLGLFAFAGSIGWLHTGGRWRLLPIAVGIAFAAWFFCNVPHDEFGVPLSLQNRIVYLVPGVMLLLIHAGMFIRSGNQSPETNKWSPALFLFLSAFSIIVFLRANYFQPQAGVVRAVVCLDAQTGAVLWTTPVYVGPAEKRHSLNSLATPTPACDGERVYAYFGSGLAALDTSGRLLWLKRDEDFAGYIRYGAGSSVTLADDRILIYRDSEFMGHGDHLDDDFQSQTNRRPSALMAIDKATGVELWSVAPPFSHDSYVTPLIWTRDGQREVVVATWKTLAGFALSDGTLRWTHTYPMQQVVPSPAVHGDCLIVTGGNQLPCPIVAIRAPTTATDKAQTVWSNGKTGGNIVSPVCHNGLLFSVSHVGVLTCRDADSGQPYWTERLDSRCLASLVAGDGKVYALDQQGKLSVFAAYTNGTMLATISLDETCAATPALANNIFVRTSGHLCCIGASE